MPERRFPIDGHWFTERELTSYLLGQLEVESHHRARQVEYAPIQALPETLYEAPKKAKPVPIVRVQETRGIEA